VREMAGAERETSMKHRGSIGAVLLLVLGLAAVTPVLSADGAMATAAVRIFQFQPGALEVRAGTRVTWTNQDDIAHTVTSGQPGNPDGRFDVQLRRARRLPLLLRATPVDAWRGRSPIAPRIDGSGSHHQNGDNDDQGEDC
jgi:plastocyanin